MKNRDRNHYRQLDDAVLSHLAQLGETPAFNALLEIGRAHV